ncbi:MAG: FtsX-like permease family protein, partial [Catalinimonas sp.]
GRLRNALVVFQFAVSICLLIGTAVVYRQLQHLQEAKLGFDQEQVLVLDDTGVLGERADAFREDLLKLPQVENVTITSSLPGGADYTHSVNGYYLPGHEGDLHLMFDLETDARYVPTLGLELVAGRNFDPARASDSTAMLVNEATVRHLGWAEPLGQEVISGGGERYRVVGVVKDFHLASLRDQIEPVLMRQDARDFGNVALRLSSGDPAATLDAVRARWEAFDTGQPLAYSFLDEEVERHYAAEQRTGQLFAIFCGLSIFVACLGLFGLAAFTAQQRTKEVGIRKVLGASVPQLIALLSKDFVRLVLVALLIAAPVAWWGATRWLEDFAYRVDVSPLLVVAAGVVTLLIAGLTVGYHALRAATTNPTTSLRSE